MDKLKRSFVTDIFFLALVTLVFGGMIFFAVDHTYLVNNSIALTAMAVVLVITYFTNLIVGLLLNAAVLLFFVGFMLYRYLPIGANPPMNIYFWLLWMPLVTVCFSLFSRAAKEVQKQNIELQKHINKFAVIDPLTNLKNLHGFENDAAIYMQSARKAGQELALVMWELRQQDLLTKTFSEQVKQEFTQALSEALQQKAGGQCTLYLLDTVPLTFGCLVFGAADDVEKTTKKLQEIKSDTVFYKEIGYDVKISHYEKREAALPLSLIEQAE